MGPKKALTAEEGNDYKSLDFLSEEISIVKLQQKSILDLVEEMKALRNQNAKTSEQAKVIVIRNIKEMDKHK
ncbi:hypothetical protein GBF38_017552 [Nibea albiflora]|uniref:Uncharacterized protein n=1 Tax=Nibea albiflora TaxID=240163 RepID=A0ACB7FKL7_NIBAL|nr:hypothetical protein GBF38_017552 [Nibea albiflora]